MKKILKDMTLEEIINKCKETKDCHKCKMQELCGMFGDNPGGLDNIPNGVKLDQVIEDE